jgi:phospholipid/cholesterol/gamma-HCH transport system substrate-binding protein
VNGLNSNTDSIFGSIERVREFTGNAEDLISDIRPDIRHDIRGASRAAEVYAGAKSDLSDTLRGFPPFLSGLARVTQYGSWVNLYACNISINLPAVASVNLDVLEPVLGDTHTEVCR